MRTASHNAVVLDQYNTRASAYVNSAVHAAGEDLDLIAQIVANQRGAVALDVGCGGGHLTYRLAPLVSEVVGLEDVPSRFEGRRGADAGPGPKVHVDPRR